MAHNIIESHILEANLFHCFLEVDIVEHFERISINKKHCIAFNFRVPRLN